MANGTLEFKGAGGDSDTDLLGADLSPKTKAKLEEQRTVRRLGMDNRAGRVTREDVAKEKKPRVLTEEGIMEFHFRF